MDIKAPTTVAELQDLNTRWNNAIWFLENCDNPEQYKACQEHIHAIEKVIDSVRDNFLYDDEHGEPIGVKE